MLTPYYTSGQPDSYARKCGDCRYLKAAVSWWCVNKKAIADRGTAIPGTANCTYWKPMRSIESMSKFRRFLSNTHLEIDLDKIGP